jgi:hypothetical protein
VSELPAGWDLDRVKAMGVREVQFLPIDTYCVFDERDATRNDYVELAPTAILDCGGLCLVRNREDDLWYMGSRASSGEIVCWAAYDDLGDAIRGL